VVSHIPTFNFFLPLKPLLILYMVHYAYSKSRDLFLAPAQSAGVDVYLTVGVLACFIAERPINKFQRALFFFFFFFFALGDWKAYPAH